MKDGIVLPAGIQLDDPRPIAAGSPYTYFLPADAELAALEPGDHVKTIFRETAGGCEFDAERMWVLLDAIDGGFAAGRLDNEPSDMPSLRCGDAVRVPLTHVIDVNYREGKQWPDVPERREYWDRCLVDPCVIDGRSHADYLYREEPDMTRDGDKYPDSGWRIRGTDEGIEEDKSVDKAPEYVAIGVVLNADDRWLHLLDQEVGCAFKWDAVQDDYVEHT